MKNQQSINWKDAKLAILYAISFVLAVIVYRLWDSEQVSNTWKIISIVAYGTYAFKIFSHKEIITFAGYCMLMVGFNYVWQEKSIELFWKIAATVAVLAQFYTLGDKGKTATIEK